MYQLQVIPLLYSAIGCIQNFRLILAMADLTLALVVDMVVAVTTIIVVILVKQVKIQVLDQNLSINKDHPLERVSCFMTIVISRDILRKPITSLMDTLMTSRRRKGSTSIILVMLLFRTISLMTLCFLILLA